MDLQEIGWGRGLDCSDWEERPVAGCFECSAQPLGSVKYEEFLD